MTQELKMKKMKMNIEPLMLGPGLAVLCVNPHRFIHSEMCFKTVTSYVRRTMDRRPPECASSRLVSNSTSSLDDADALAMAFILGGFSHLFAFKGAYQAEVRADDRRRRARRGRGRRRGD